MRGVSRSRKWSPRDAPWESDAELVREILSGSRDHFEMLYRVYFPRVYRFALKRLGDPGEAEDVTQEVFMTVFRVLHTYAGDSSLLVWIFGITRNKVNRRFRGIRPRFEVIDTDTEPGIATKDASADRVVDARRVLEQCEAVVQNRVDAAAEANLPSEAPAKAIDPLHRRRPRQVGRCREGEPLPDATRDRPSRTGSRTGSGRLSLSDRPPVPLLPSPAPRGEEISRHESPILATYLM